jgi:coenzyme PQQ synthesis protein D (PqqD)
MTGHGLVLRLHVTATNTPGGMVLLNQRTGQYWQLNVTAALTPRALLGGAAPTRSAALAERHPAAAGRADQDVADLLDSPRAADILTE